MRFTPGSKQNVETLAQKQEGPTPKGKADIALGRRQWLVLKASSQPGNTEGLDGSNYQREGADALRCLRSVTLPSTWYQYYLVIAITVIETVFYICTQ